MDTSNFQVDGLLFSLNGRDPLKFRKDVFSRVTGLLFVVQRRVMP
jgi:hypothetical protein